MPSQAKTHRHAETSSKRRRSKSAPHAVNDRQTIPATNVQTANDVQQLQRTVGNQAVSRLLAQTAQPVQDAGPQLRQGTTQAPLIQRKLILDGAEIKTLEDLKGQYAEMAETIKKLIDLPGPPVKVTVAQLKKVHAYITGPKKSPPHPEDAEAILAIMQLLSHGAWTRRAEETSAFFNEPQALRSVKDLGKVLTLYPNLVRNLEAAGVGWHLGESDKDQVLTGLGGAGVLKDERIHVQKWVFMQDEFLGIVEHEVGHATFQRMLIRGENWTDRANKGEEEPDTKALVEDGKEFYAAWKVIRQNPKNFFIVDLPGDEGSYAKGEGRGKYLAGGFDEFCAESFKHLARGEIEDLQAHVAELPEKEAQAKAAWGKAIKILQKYEHCLLGKDEDSSATATLKNHRFITALSKLKEGLKKPELEFADKKTVESSLANLEKFSQAYTGEERENYLHDMQTTAKAVWRNHQFITALNNLKEGLKGSGLEIANAGAVEADLADLRKFWQALTGEEHGYYRSEMLKILDQFMMKVQRRRPAQVHIGSELGFANL